MKFSKTIFLWRIPFNPDHSLDWFGFITVIIFYEDMLYKLKIWTLYLLLVKIFQHFGMLPLPSQESPAAL